MRWVIVLIILLFLAPKTGSCSILITGTFMDTDIRQVLQDISRQAGVNIILDNTIQGFISLELKETPLEKALEMVVSSGSYVYCKKDGYYIIGLPDIESSLFNSLTKTVFYTPKYVSGEFIIQRIGDSFSPFIKANEALNTISITATEPLLSDILNKLKEIDKPSKIVLVEAILERGYIKSTDESSIDWGWKWQINSNNTGQNSSLSFKDLKIGYIYKSSNEIQALLTLLEGRENLIQLAQSRCMVLEGESAKISFEEELFKSLDRENISFSSISSLLSIDVHPIVKNKEISIDLKINSDYTVDSSIKKTGGVTTSINLTEDRIVVIGGVIEEREALTKRGAFSPIIPSGEKTQDSFTIFLYAKAIPEYTDASMITATQFDVYKKYSFDKESNSTSNGLNISGYPVSIADIVAKGLTGMVIKSGLEINGTLPIDKNNTLSLSMLYIPDGIKTGKLEVDSSTNEPNTYIGLGYRSAAVDPLSLNCLYTLIVGKTYPVDGLTLGGKLFGALIKDNIENSYKGTVGINLSSNYKISKDISLNLEYFRTYEKDILSSVRLELDFKLKSFPHIILGYDVRESNYQDNLLDNSYGRGVYVKINWNL